jgi:hypothetical protein
MRWSFPKISVFTLALRVLSSVEPEPDAAVIGGADLAIQGGSNKPHPDRAKSPLPGLKSKAGNTD